jgi:hypothetical protein|tara:strand:+ start:83 stop:499 length:417 start_codon:yes stop_codon:yes gene_type:complete
MRLITNLFINFCVGFISDIILNDLSRIHNLKYLNSLYPYFNNNHITIAAIYAGLTTSFCIYLAYFLNKHTSINYYLSAFIVGYIIDIIIEKYKIFNNLESYYNTAGSGIWGGLAILFSAIISSLGYYYFLPIIYACKK